MTLYVKQSLAKEHVSFQGYIPENETQFKNIHFEALGSILE
jgi:hypothetical protein